MKRLAVIVFICTFFAAIFASNVDAQPSSVPAASAAGETISAPANASTSAAEPVEKRVSPAAEELFNVFGLPVTNSMVCTWIVAALIFTFLRLSTWRLQEVPSGGQNLMESIVEGWESLMGDILDPKVTRWVFPFATTFFIFIVVSNYVDLIPGVGSIGKYSADKTDFTPYFRPPTTDANLTMAMAGIFLLMSVYWALRYNGPWGLVKHIFGVKMKTSKWVFPLFFLLFVFIGLMESLSIFFVRPVALAMRLYGNIFGGQTVIEMMLHHKSFLVAVVTSLPFYFYEVFVCFLQAFVFALLVVAFVGTLCTHDDEEH